jgi:putative FmdB family regulatory protein
MSPIYTFECGHCGAIFDSLSKPYEPVACRECHAQGAERVITGFGGYVIKGDNSASQRPKGAGHRGGK